MLSPVASDRTHGHEHTSVSRGVQLCEHTSRTDTNLTQSREGISPPPFQVQPVKKLGTFQAIARTNIFSHTNISLKPREQLCLARVITQHPEGEREAERDRKNSSREKLGKPEKDFSTYNHLGRIMADLYKRSNQSAFQHTLLLLGLIR